MDFDVRFLVTHSIIYLPRIMQMFSLVAILLVHDSHNPRFIFSCFGYISRSRASGFLIGWRIVTDERFEYCWNRISDAPSSLGKPDPAVLAVMRESWHVPVNLTRCILLYSAIIVINAWEVGVTRTWWCHRYRKIVEQVDQTIVVL